ncbi:MAG: LL-diaminopimelate aminotransferase [Planctomycetota bacterium]|nr:LL-diaminopimelate aminotransferase [Planctomycetota bacterium]
MARLNDHYLKLAGAYLFPEIARRVDEYVRAHTDAEGEIIRCGIGDVTEPLPAAVVEAMHNAVDEMARGETFRGYGPPTGYPFLREAIARGDFDEHGLDIRPDEIFISDGSKTDCGAVLDVLGDDNRIGIGDPVYPVYVDSNVMAGHTGPAREDGGYEGLVYLPCTAENGFVPDLPGPPDDTLDLIYLCYPNNPTGGMISRPQLQAWVDYALAHDTIIIYDAAYQYYLRDETAPWSIYEIDGARRCAIELHSFSKNGGFTGVRCGYSVCPAELSGTTRSGEKVPLHRLWTRRWSTKANSVGYVVQRAAEALYSDAGRQQVRALVDHYLENARLLREGCEAIGLRAWGGENSPYVWVACPDGLSSWQMFDRMLDEARVVITPGVGFGRCGEGYVRISAFNSRENAMEVVRRMRAMTAQAV